MPTKVHLVKAMVFPVVMYGCESWAIKKTECRRIEASELGCWRKLLGVPWTVRRSNKSIVKEISPEYSLEGTDVEAETPMLWPSDAKNWLLEKHLDAGKDWGRRRRGWQRMRWFCLFVVHVSGLWHFLSPLPGLCLHQMAAWSASSLPSDLCSDVIQSVRSSLLTTCIIINPPRLPLPSSLPCFIFSFLSLSLPICVGT